MLRWIETRQMRRVFPDASRVPFRFIRTGEELMIARLVRRVENSAREESSAKGWAGD